jgi:hypothetical protein
LHASYCSKFRELLIEARKKGNDDKLVDPLLLLFPQENSVHILQERRDPEQNQVDVN